MMTRQHWATATALTILWACAQGIAPDVTTHAAAPPLEFVELVTGGATAKETLPLLIAIHGLGDRPEAFIRLFADLKVKARIVAPRAPDPWGHGSSWYPIDDEQRKTQVIRERAQQVAELLTHLTQARPTRGQPVVSGFSQGAVLTFALAAAHPDRLRAAIPIAGSLPPALLPKNKLQTACAVWALHGRADPRISFADGDRTVRKLRDRGLAANMLGFDGVGHTVSGPISVALFAKLHELLGPQAGPDATARRGPVPAQEVRSLAASPQKKSPNGKATVRLLARGDNAFLGRLEMVAGAAVPEHQDPTEEYIHVLEGHGTLTMNGQKYEIGPGTTIFMPAFATVSYQNGSEPFVGLQVFAGPGPAAKYDAWK